MNCMYVKVIQASATITAIVRRRHFEFDYFGKRYVLNIDCSFKLWLGLMSNSWINWNAKQPHHHKITSTCVTLCTFSPNLCSMFNVDALSQIHFRFNSFNFHRISLPIISSDHLSALYSTHEREITITHPFSFNERLHRQSYVIWWLMSMRLRYSKARQDNRQTDALKVMSNEYV